MTLYLSNRNGNGKTDEIGHFKPIDLLLNGTVGITATSMQVTQNSPLGLNVLVLSGHFMVDSTDGTSNFSYFGWHPGSGTVISLQTADTANPRIDCIVLYIDKSATTSAVPANNPNIPKFIAVKGTAAPSPVAPNSTAIQTAVGANNPYIILANVTVPANATQIVNANISDQRSQMTIAPNLVRTTSIEDGAVTTAKIVDSNITTAKIANLAVTTGKLADLSVTAAKIETQQAWQTPAMLNGWVRYDTTHDNVGYMKDSLGFVHLRGLIRSGTAGTVFTLPVGYRPLFRRIYPCVSNQTIARLDVRADGVIELAAYNNAWVSLEGVTFKAEQ